MLSCTFVPSDLMDLAAGCTFYITLLYAFINLATIFQQHQLCFFNLYLIYWENIPLLNLTGRDYDDRHKDMKTTKLRKRDFEN